MFLSPRAVSLLVCNIEAFGQGDGCTSDRDQLKRDLNKLQELRVCDWLRSLSFRIPDSDVVVVATKCDLVAGGMAQNLAGRTERAIRRWLESWRGSKMTAVRVEDDVSLTSCAASVASGEEGDDVLGKRKESEGPMWACDWREDVRDDFPPSMLHRVMYNSNGELRGAAMVLPRSWSMALEVLEALGSGRQAQNVYVHSIPADVSVCFVWVHLADISPYNGSCFIKTQRPFVLGYIHRDPVESVLRMKLAVDGREGMEGLASTCFKQHEGIEGLTMADLSAKWRAVVEALEGDRVKVTNPDHALEGALCIRYAELGNNGGGICDVVYIRYKCYAPCSVSTCSLPRAICCGGLCKNPPVGGNRCCLGPWIDMQNPPQNSVICCA